MYMSLSLCLNVLTLHRQRVLLILSYYLLLHELDDLVFVSELWQRILVLTFQEILNSWEARDLEAIPHSLVHCGIHSCQHTRTL